MTVCTRKSRQASAVVTGWIHLGRQVGAAAAVLAWRLKTLVEIVAQGPTVPRSAGTSVSTHKFNAGGSVLTRLRCALEHILSTGPARVRRRACASKVVYSVNALSAVEARGVGAIVNVNVAIQAGKSCGALAHKRLNAINARASVETGNANAIVDVQLTVAACKTSIALALEAAKRVQAAASPAAADVVAGALVDVIAAGHPFKSGLAGADKTATTIAAATAAAAVACTCGTVAKNAWV